MAEPGGLPSMGLQSQTRLKQLSSNTACGTLVPQPGIILVPPALEMWSLNFWITREVPA